MFADTLHRIYREERIRYIFYTIDPRGNPCESRSKIYRTSVSSLVGVNLCRPLRMSARGGLPLIRTRMELSGTSYIFTVCRTDIFLIVQIASMARVSLVSLGRIDILCVYRNDVWRKEVVVQAKSAHLDRVCNSMVNHVRISLLKERYPLLNLF